LVLSFGSTPISFFKQQSLVILIGMYLRMSAVDYHLHLHLHLQYIYI